MNPPHPPGTPSVAWVLFDAVGTLLFPASPVVDVYHQHGQRHGSNVQRQELLDAFPQAFEEHFNAHPLTRLQSSEHLEKQHWQNLVADLFADLADSEALFQELWQHYAEPESWQACTQLSLLVSALQDAGIGVGVASNFDDRLIRISNHFFPSIPREWVFTSSSLGYSKPHLGFFQSIEALLGCTPSQLTLVGDDPIRDIEGARRAGWQAIHRDDRSQLHSLVHDGDRLQAPE